MLLSKYINQSDIPEHCYGIVVDEEIFDLPSEIKEIGLIIDVGKDGQPTEMFLDVAFSFSLSGVNVIIEVPFMTAIDATYLTSIAANANLSLSILPPEDATDENVKLYGGILGTYAKEFLGKNMAGSLFPITSYLEYMFAELITDVSEYKPTDEYIITKFHEKLSLEQQNEIKSMVRDVVHEGFGGSESFSAYGLTLMNKIFKQTKENVIDFASRENEVSQQA